MPRKKLIRKQPLLDKIRSYPFDLLLSINEQRLSVDWDDYIPQCLPIGTIASFGFLLLCKLKNHYQKVNSKRQNMVFRTDHSTYQQVMSHAISGTKYTPNPGSYSQHDTFTSTVLWTINSILLSMFIISFLNTFNLYYFPYRDYSLLSSTAKAPRPKASNVLKQNISNEPPSGILSKIYSYFEGNSYYETDVESDADTTIEPQVINKDIWVLRVWDPSLFSLHLSVSFSPVVLTLLWLLSSAVPVWKLASLILFFNVSCFILVTKLTSLISDKQIVYQETFKEYNKKYVIPKTSVLKKNAMIDATRGPRVSARKTVHDDVHGHIQNDLAFISHDINGKRLKSVRADFAGDEILSRAASPARQLPNNIVSSPARHDSMNTWITSSTPYAARHAGNTSRLSAYEPVLNPANESFLYRNDTFTRPNDTFSRPTSSRAPSPNKSPSRLPYNANISYGHNTQLSPNRSSRHSSPQRSPSPSKRVWH